MATIQLQRMEAETGMFSSTYLVELNELAAFLDRLTPLFTATNRHFFHGHHPRTLKLSQITSATVIRGPASARNKICVRLDFEVEEFREMAATSYEFLVAIPQLKNRPILDAG